MNIMKRLATRWTIWGLRGIVWSRHPDFVGGESLPMFTSRKSALAFLDAFDPPLKNRKLMAPMRIQIWGESKTLPPRLRAQVQAEWHKAKARTTKKG